MTETDTALADELAWLIEFPEVGDRYEYGKRVGPARPVEWLAGIPWGERWKSRTNDPNKAIRFARKVDAEAAMLIMQIAGTAAFACEHMWHSLRHPAPRADDGLRIENEALRAGLGKLLDATERHVFGDECLAERVAARGLLESRP